MNFPNPPEIPGPTIGIDDVTIGDCGHCHSKTVQVMGGKGLIQTEEGRTTELACLQCIADGGNCCSLSPLNRYV